MDCIYYLVNIYFFKVIYLHTSLLGGWDSSQIMVFVGTYLLIDAINMTVFSSNLWWLPYYINRGDLDYYLIRPVSPLFFLTLREFSANSFMNLLIAASFFVYAVTQLPGTHSPGEFLSFLLLIINGAVLHACLQLLTILPVFWTHSARGFVDLFYTLGLAMERPHRIYTGFMRIVFTTILPFSLVASFPAQLFLEGPKAETLVHLTLVSVSFWFIVSAFWKLGLKSYASASS